MDSRSGAHNRGHGLDYSFSRCVMVTYQMLGAVQDDVESFISVMGYSECSYPTAMISSKVKKHS